MRPFHFTLIWSSDLIWRHLKAPTWRIFQSWSLSEYGQLIEYAQTLSLNHEFHAPEVFRSPSYQRICSESIVGHESSGRPVVGGSFDRGCEQILTYQFSDPNKVERHSFTNQVFELESMLLEIKAFGFKILGSVRVTDVRRTEDENKTQFGFRYDTLHGHSEDGCEWFILTKYHSSGDICFKISAAMRPGTFPKWWIRFGYLLVGKLLRIRWHRSCHSRMKKSLSDKRKINSEIRITRHQCRLGFINSGW